MSAYYNENDPFAASWLRSLILNGLIADGEVDERSIADVRPADLDGFTQCHFFAGIGGWSYALRLAGWSDDRPVWTGSCPCQPFSAAGKSKGFADERHVWPEWFHLIEQRRPAILFGEQVAGIDGLAWLDLIQDDMEGIGYAVGATNLCAAGIGAPHARQRLYWGSVGSLSLLRELPLPDSPDARARLRVSTDRGLARSGRGPVYRCSTGSGMADTARAGLQGFTWDGDERNEPRRKPQKALRPKRDAGVWDDVSVMFCRDGRYRPIPLADGISDRLDNDGAGDETAFAVEQRRTMIVRGFGNAIVPQVAQVFIEAFMSI